MNIKVIKKNNKYYKQVEERVNEKELRRDLAILKKRESDLKINIKRIEDTLKLLSDS